MTPTPHPLLIETLRDAQRFGFFGPRPIEQAIDHSRGFVVALEGLEPGASILDIGSGGGLPGLVLADAFRGVDVTLIDRRQKRTDFLLQAVARLEFDHVHVVCDDVMSWTPRVLRARGVGFDAVTARGFGPPDLTLRAAARLMTDGGAIVVSEPPSGERWNRDLLEELGLGDLKVGSVRRFGRS